MARKEVNAEHGREVIVAQRSAATLAIDLLKEVPALQAGQAAQAAWEAFCLSKWPEAPARLFKASPDVSTVMDNIQNRRLSRVEYSPAIKAKALAMLDTTKAGEQATS